MIIHPPSWPPLAAALIDAQGGYLCTGTVAEATAPAAVLRGEWGPIPPVLPACSGGLTAGTLASNYAAFGRDILPMAGSAIFNHPDGAAAGAAALRQAAELDVRFGPDG